MSKSKVCREDLYTCIVIYSRDGKSMGAKFKNIQMDLQATRLKNLSYWKSKYPGATHVNVYGGATRQFKEQIKF